MPISPISFTITAVSPIAGWPSRLAISVVLPLPRKPVTSATGSLPSAAKGVHETWVERVERAAGEALCLHPEHAQVVDDGRPALAVVQDVDSAAPVVEPQAEVIEHPVRELHPEDPRPAPAVLLGPVLIEEYAAESAHVVAL